MSRPLWSILLLTLTLSGCSAPRPTIAPGGHLRSSAVSAGSPLPMPGFGLYVYVLPGIEVAQAMVDALSKYHDCLMSTVASEPKRSVALVLLPVKHELGGDKVDVQLAHAFLQAMPMTNIDEKEVYFVATNRPLHLDSPTAGTEVIKLGRIAPAYVAPWLVEFQENIERGEITRPSDWVPRLKSAGLIVSSVGTLFGIKPANAASSACQ